MFYRSPTAKHAGRLRRAWPVAVLAGLAFAIGAIAGAGHGDSSSHELALRFVRAWTRGEYATMYADIGPPARRSESLSEFIDAYQSALRTATATGLRLDGGARDAPGGLVAVPVRVSTRLFGELALDFELPVTRSAEGARLAWSRSLAFPGLAPGELLARRTSLPRRATLLARDRSVLAESPQGTRSEGAGEGVALAAQLPALARSSPLGPAATAVLGSLGPVPRARREALEAEGVPADAIVGVGGLEQALDARLRGTPGGS